MSEIEMIGSRIDAGAAGDEVSVADVAWAARIGAETRTDLTPGAGGIGSASTGPAPAPSASVSALTQGIAPSAAVERGAFREAMSRMASAVHIVTTAGAGGRAGFTASAVCSVSDSPPTLLVCINRASSAHAVFSANDALCVSTLGAGQESLAGAFGGGVPASGRFALAEWSTLATGAPALVGALTAFDCRIVARHAIGTHDVLYCEVQAIAAPAQAEPLLYAGRAYRTLPRADDTRPVTALRIVRPTCRPPSRAARSA